MKLAGWLLLGAALVARSTPALACGASNPPYYVVSDQAPSGEDVPLNAPLLVELAESADGPVYPEISPSLVLTLEGEGEAVPLVAVSRVPHLAWVPSSRLQPGKTYEAHYNPGYEGHPDSIWQFTTGDSVKPAITLEGSLQATLEPGSDPILECSTCGSDCVEKGRRPVTQARLRLPRVASGFDPRRGELWLTDDSAFTFPAPDQDSAPSTEGHTLALVTSVTFDAEGYPTSDILVTLPEEDAPYRPCFALRVTDGRGDRATAEPLCLAETFPNQGASPPQDDTQEPVLGNGASNTSSACAFGRERLGASSALGALLLVGAAALRRRLLGARR